MKGPGTKGLDFLRVLQSNTFPGHKTQPNTSSANNASYREERYNAALAPIGNPTEIQHTSTSASTCRKQ